MQITLQVDSATSFIRATVTGSVETSAPDGVTFFMLNLDSLVPPKPYYVNGAFKYFYDGAFQDDPPSPT